MAGRSQLIMLNSMPSAISFADFLLWKAWEQFRPFFFQVSWQTSIEKVPENFKVATATVKRPHKGTSVKTKMRKSTRGNRGFCFFLGVGRGTTHVWLSFYLIWLSGTFLWAGELEVFNHQACKWAWRWSKGQAFCPEVGLWAHPTAYPHTLWIIYTRSSNPSVASIVWPSELFYRIIES